MQTIIQTADFSLTTALDRFIRDQSRQSLRVCADQVESLIIRLKDTNGPKGGDDKECIVEVIIPDHAPVVVRKRSSDAYASIRSALQRASRTALRRLNKRRASQKGGHPRRLNSRVKDFQLVPQQATTGIDAT